MLGAGCTTGALAGSTRAARSVLLARPVPQYGQNATCPNSVLPHSALVQLVGCEPCESPTRNSETFMSLTRGAAGYTGGGGGGGVPFGADAKTPASSGTSAA